MQTTPEQSAGAIDRAWHLAPSTRPSTAPVDAAALSIENRHGSGGHSRYFLRYPTFVVAGGDRATAGGGHAADRVVREAAHRAAQLAASVRVRRARNDDEMAKALLRIPGHCRDLLRADAAAVRELAAMATTLALVLIDWPMAHIVSVGDGPCYLFRGDTLIHLAGTLALAGSQRDTGARGITADDTGIQPHHARLELRPNDTLILCTRSVTTAVPEPEMGRIVSTAASASEACAWLRMAIRNAHLGTDATGIVVRFLGLLSP